jgi:hypothetical protein
VQKLSTGNWTERVEPLTQDSFELLELHQANVAPERNNARRQPTGGQAATPRYLGYVRAVEILLLEPRRRSRSRPRPARSALPGAFSPLIDRDSRAPSREGRSRRGSPTGVLSAAARSRALG